MRVYLTEEAASYLVRKVDEADRLGLGANWIGRKIVATAAGNSYNGAFVLGHRDRKALREFCRQATGHHHFHHITALDFKDIGRLAIDFADFI